MASEFTIETATSADDELVEAAARLVPQLSSSAAVPGLDELAEVVASPGSVVFLARADGSVIGMLTLVTYRIPTGVNAVIEDVVVDADHGRKGAGQALVAAALEEASRRGARHVDLTSRPSREAANHLYQKMGFAKRETNVYRRSLQ